jgi:FkbM family methyltransferase
MLSNLIDFFVQKWLYRKSVVHNNSLPKLAVWSNDYIGAAISIHGYFEKPYIDAVNRLLDSLDLQFAAFVDCGANIGNHSVFLGHRFRSVIAVEAHPANFRLLQVNCSGSRYILVNKAASDVRQDVRMKTVGVNMGGTKITDAGPSDHSPYVITEADRLDCIVGDQEEVEFLKIDVEGHELQVLRGAPNLLGKKPVIMFEQNSWDTANASETAAGLLKAKGYKFIVFRSNDPNEPGSKIQKLRRLFFLTLFGPRVAAATLESVPPGETFACVVAIHPSRHSISPDVVRGLNYGCPKKAATKVIER